MGKVNVPNLKWIEFSKIKEQPINACAFSGKAYNNEIESSGTGREVYKAGKYGDVKHSYRICNGWIAVALYEQFNTLCGVKFGSRGDCYYVQLYNNEIVPVVKVDSRGTVRRPTSAGVLEIYGGIRGGKRACVFGKDGKASDSGAKINWPTNDDLGGNYYSFIANFPKWKNQTIKQIAYAGQYFKIGRPKIIK